MGFFNTVFRSKKQKAHSARPPSPDKRMYTLSRPLLVEPFAEINYWHLPNGGKQVQAFILMEHPIEGMQTGVAIDGSASMKKPFGRVLLGQPTQKDINQYHGRHMVRFVQQDDRSYNTWSEEAVKELVTQGIFRYAPNVIEPQVRKMTDYLSNFDADGGTSVIYWATGKGQRIEEVGELMHAQCATAHFTGPQTFGDETHLLPAIEYFIHHFSRPPWGLYVFITDGILHDLEAVQDYSIQLARHIASGRRNPVKFVLIGVGDEIDKAQLESLDDLDTGTDVDLWDHKISSEMQRLAEVFAEVVSESVIVAPRMGVIKDAVGNIIQDYRATGLPALLRFELPPGHDTFTLEVGGKSITQTV